MSKVITFSRFFPAYHPKAGRPTHFVEKIHRSLDPLFGDKLKVNSDMMPVFNFATYTMCGPKHHTIRAGSRWKVGDKFSPRVWSGKPYYSKQIVIAPDIKVDKTFNFELIREKDSNFYLFAKVDGRILTSSKLQELANNDGLTLTDLISWFKAKEQKPFYFSGQIICWSNTVNY